MARTRPGLICQLVGTRSDEVVGLIAVEAESLIMATFLLLCGERVAVEGIDLHGHDIGAVRVKRSRVYGGRGVGVIEVVWGTVQTGRGWCSGAVDEKIVI